MVFLPVSPGLRILWQASRRERRRLSEVQPILASPAWWVENPRSGTWNPGMNLRAEFRTPRAARLVSVHLGKLHRVAHVFPAALRGMATQCNDLLKLAKTAAKSRAGFNEWQTVRNTLGF